MSTTEIKSKKKSLLRLVCVIVVDGCVRCAVVYSTRIPYLPYVQYRIGWLCLSRTSRMAIFLRVFGYVPTRTVHYVFEKTNVIDCEAKWQPNLWVSFFRLTIVASWLWHCLTESVV
jgi:hypothetical protein